MPLDDRILDQAAAWAVRTGDPSFEDWEGFTAWLESDPAHARAYDLVVAETADAAEALAAIPAAANDDAPIGQTRRRFIGGAIAAALVGAATFSLWQFQGSTYTVETAPGETRVIALDGSGEITLGGGTTLTLDRDDPHFAQLDKGQALFSITHDEANPFRVLVGEDELVDIGTVFDVHYNNQTTTLAVAEGAVVFNPAQQNVRVDPGKRLWSDEGSRAYELSPIATADIGAWKAGRLAFQNTTLAAVADDLTRATGLHFEADAVAAKRRISGSVLVDPMRADPSSIGPLLGVKMRKTKEGWMFER